MKHLQTILHPTDFSDCSHRAFELAGSLARERGARLIILHVKPPCGTKAAQRPLPPLPVQADDLDRWEALQQFQAVVPGVQVETWLAEGEPGEVILRWAREAGCDLIVMGTHGRTGLIR